MGMQFATRTLRYGEHSCLRAQVSLPPKGSCLQARHFLPSIYVAELVCFSPFVPRRRSVSVRKGSELVPKPRMCFASRGDFGHAAVIALLFCLLRRYFFF